MRPNSSCAKAWLAGVLISAAASGALSQTPDAIDKLPPPKTASVVQAADLGEPVTSVEGGIRLRPPVGGTLVRADAAKTPDELFRVNGPEKSWSFVVNRIVLNQPMPLVRSTQETATGAQRQVDGFIDVASRQIPSQTPGTLLRTDLTPIAGVNGAMLASRFNDMATGKKRLMQQAIVGRTDRLYYIVTLNTPLTDGDAQTDIEQDPLAQQAVAIFESTVSSIELLNQTDLRNDQEDRLIRTRSLLINWNESKLRGTVVPQTWIRILKGDQDIGYSYVVEEIANGLPQAGAGGGVNANAADQGFRVGIRTRLMLPAQPMAETEAWMWTRFDRSEEMFTSASVLFGPGQKAINWTQEVGRSNKSSKTVLDPAVVNPNNPGVTSRDLYTLDVTIESKEAATPAVKKQLPPYYLPQAIGHVLPRLVPTNVPETFLAATYISDSKQVMLQYIDVRKLEPVTIAGRTFQAIPVVLRLGLEGAATTHYLSPRGEWLGSRQELSDIVMVPVTSEQLLTIWKDADLSRPKDVK